MVKKKKTKSVLRIDDEEMREAVSSLVAHLHEGMSDDQARNEMGLEFDEFDEVKREMYAQMTARLQGRSNAEVYVDYFNSQMSCVRDLDNLLMKLEDTKQHNASVGAIRTISDIHDKMLKVGQDLGVITKTKKVIEHKHTGGIVIATLSDKELKRHLSKELKKLEGFVDKWGGGDIIDVTPGELHRDAPKMRPALSASTSRVHKGRRRDREAIEA